MLHDSFTAACNEPGAKSNYLRRQMKYYLTKLPPPKTLAYLKTKIPASEERNIPLKYQKHSIFRKYCFT